MGARPAANDPGSPGRAAWSHRSRAALWSWESLAQETLQAIDGAFLVKKNEDEKLVEYNIISTTQNRPDNEYQYLLPNVFLHFKHS